MNQTTKNWFGVIALVAIIFAVVSLTSKKMVCKSEEGNITLMYNDKTIKGYTAKNITYDLVTQKQYAEKIFTGLSTKKKEEAVLEVILNTDIDKRLEICNSYLSTYNRDLYSDIKSKLSGQFKEAAIHLFLPPSEFMAKMLKNGLKGFSIDESMIYEIFTSCNQEELKQIELAYKKETNKELSKEIEKNFPAAIRRNLLNLLNIPRNVNENPNRVECEKWAENLIPQG